MLLGQLLLRLLLLPQLGVALGLLEFPIKGPTGDVTIGSNTKGTGESILTGAVADVGCFCSRSIDSRINSLVVRSLLFFYSSRSSLSLCSDAFFNLRLGQTLVLEGFSKYQETIFELPLLLVQLQFG